jgi:hypothetical protein
MGRYLQGKTEVMGKMPSHCRSVHHTSRLALHGVESGTPGWERHASDTLSNGTNLNMCHRVTCYVLDMWTRVKLLIQVLRERRTVQRADNHITCTCQLSWNLEDSTSWNPQGLPGITLPSAFVCCLFLALRPNAGHGLLIHDFSRSHTTTHHSR